jgi:DNA-binding NtrC family response regulator
MVSEHSRRVLVVDDDVDTCNNLSDILTDFGYEVMTANNGPDALDLVRKHAFDVALLDLKMPGMDGLMVYREIKKLSSGTVGMIVTAYATGDSAEQARHAGVWQILSKPVDLGRLMPLVDEAAHQPLLLVVDDDRELCENLWDIFRERGYRVSIVNDEVQAAGKLKDEDHCVVLIDMKLAQGNAPASIDWCATPTPKRGSC